MLQRDGDGFPLDQSRIAYLRYLRCERQQSPRSEADAEFTAAKTRLMRLRIEEKEKTLMETAEALDVVERLVGAFRTTLGSLPAQIAGHDLTGVIRPAFAADRRPMAAPKIRAIDQQTANASGAHFFKRDFLISRGWSGYAL